VALNYAEVVTASLRGPSRKPRPFLVLRSGHFAGHSMITLVAFTTALIEAPTLRVTVQPTEENGLRVPSQAMVDHIQSVRESRIDGDRSAQQRGPAGRCTCRSRLFGLRIAVLACRAPLSPLMAKSRISSHTTPCRDVAPAVSIFICSPAYG
jgi:mRNA interferase MazF